MLPEKHFSNCKAMAVHYNCLLYLQADMAKSFPKYLTNNLDHVEIGLILVESEKKTNFIIQLK